jgi:ribonucleoside-diphosphate reductase alpha chain
VCDLSSMNALYYDEWKDTDAVELLVYFLDAVMEEYITKTDGMPFMEHARNFAIRQRAIGVGILGWHSYLQSKMIPFEGFEAKSLNVQIAKTIKDKAIQASEQLATWFGEPELLEGYGRRNVTLMAIAPTTTSSFVLGQVSPSIEPLRSNYFTKDLAKGKFTYRNPYLANLLESYNKNDRDTWRSILEKDGSVQHLEFLRDNEKDVFKTFSEISPLEVVQQAAARQKHIDQSQSLNLLIDPKTPLKDVNELMFTAWELGVKSLYYQRGTNPAQEAAKNIMECSACEA